MLNKSLYAGVVGTLIGSYLYRTFVTSRASASIDKTIQTASTEQRPFKIVNGVGVILRRNGHVLMGRRLNCDGHNTWACPGGKIEPGEGMITCGLRELLEETGIDILQDGDSELIYAYPPNEGSLQASAGNDKVFELGCMNMICPDENVHMVVGYIIAECPVDAEAQNMEPEKCAGWYWVRWEDVIKIGEYHDAMYRKVDPLPPVPQLSANCPIDLHQDRLFAAVHYLVMRKHNPILARKDKISLQNY